MTKRIVIAHGGDVSYPTGGTNRITAFAAGLTDRGFDVTLVVPDPDKKLPDRLKNVTVSTVSTPNSGIVDEPIRASLIARRAKSIATQNDATVQLEHSTLGGVAQFLGHRKYVLDIHDLAHSSSRYGDLPFGTAVQRAIYGIESRAIKSASKIIVVSGRMRSLVSEEWNLDPEAIITLPNGYSNEIIRSYQTNETADGRVVFLGTLHPKLDTEAIFDIAALPSVEEMIVIGEGIKRKELEAGKETRNLTDLKICGRLSDEEAFPILARAEVAINPQTQSSLQKASSPVKLFYYAALGIPMVVTKGPDVAAKLAESGAAESVAASEHFAPRVAEVLADGERRKDMGATALELAPRWSWDQRAKRLAQLYNSRE